VKTLEQQILEVMSSSEWVGNSCADIDQLVSLAYGHFIGVPYEKLLELAFQAWFASFELELVVDPAPLLHVAIDMSAHPKLPPYGRDILRSVLQPWWDTCRDAEMLMRYAARGGYEVGCPEHRQVILLCCLMARYSDAVDVARHTREELGDLSTFLPEGMIEAVEEWAWNPGAIFVRPVMPTIGKFHLGYANHTSVIVGAVERVEFLRNEAATATERSAAAAGGGWRNDLKEAGSALLADLIRAAVPTVPMAITRTYTTMGIPYE
jgi:hypothetical protein